MIKLKVVIFLILAIGCAVFTKNAFAEDLLPGDTIPKLPKTANDPILTNGRVYPFWGPVCQRYTYSVVYQDKNNLPPEYVKMYFNGKMIDLEKENPASNDYKKGVKYYFKNVPNKFGSNFYYFEASNGKGKARASIIDSPDNGPVLFDADFKHNEIVLIDSQSGKEVWRYSTANEWVGAVALSGDGKYLVAQTSNHIYLFNTESSKPLWEYKSTVSASIGGDVKGGVAISESGKKIFAALNGKALMFNNSSNEPIWTYNLNDNGGGAYGVDITKNGQYMAVAMAGSESDQNSNVLILFDGSGKKLWQYHSSGNWHEVNFSADGKYLAGATGCPDRRGYLFSVDSAEPIIKSDPLSKESPIDEARVSQDGNLVAFGVESGYGAVVLMDKETRQIVWKYETSQGKSVRALAMTPSGEYIGAGTFGGNVLIFDKNSNQPIQEVKINSTIGAFDLADDGSFFATGSTDKKIRIFEKGADIAKAEIELKEYVGELDISGNGKYIAGGTSGSVYFFDSLIDLNSSQTFPCDSVIEPPEEDPTSFGGQNGKNNNVVDNKNNLGISLPLIVLFPLLSAGVLFCVIIIYLIYCSKRLQSTRKIFIYSILLLAIISLALAFYFWRSKTTANDNVETDSSLSGQSSQTVTDESNVETDVTVPSNAGTTSEQNVIKTEGDQSSTNTTNNTVVGDPSSTTNSNSSGIAVCGNNICEPNLGETKSSCSKDCSGGD